MFKKILIANRGEIALRVMHTCKEMGIATVAVFSDADIRAAHRLAADESVHIGPANPAESYLNMDRIITAARDTGAEAIHPGYGFLSENADFAYACQQAGIVFIGPPAEVIRNLGDKTVARQIMLNSGVPITPGMSRPDTDISVLAAMAGQLGYPVLIKAAAGGGGKGMRVVNAPESLPDACAAASREAAAAFGNGDIYLEKFIERPRHVEIQILADTAGNVIHLLERECSIQRRHQKIIEESPSPALTPELREKMGAAAVAAARAAGYVNAGTVEFLLDPQGNFYFLEVNTRLQVEHPVTEMITGVDMVRQQINIAAGNPLTLRQSDIVGRGHAIECRIYGEDPENDFFPCPGTILLMQSPSGPGVRNDCGVYAGYTVPVEYDPILSKLIVHAETREAAIHRMQKALSEYVIAGIKTPIPFLRDVLASKPFRHGETQTDFIEKHFNGWQLNSPNLPAAALAFVVSETKRRPETGRQPHVKAGIPLPWETIGNWRL